MQVIHKFFQYITDFFVVCKLKLEIRSLEKKLKSIYAKIGSDYVVTHQNDVDDVNRDLIIQAISLQKMIEDKNAHVDEIRGIQRCVACHSRIPNDALFCPFCGMRQPTPEVKVVRYCPTCGTKLEMDELFCHHCGTRIPDDNAVTEEIVLKVEDSKSEGNE